MNKPNITEGEWRIGNDSWDDFEIISDGSEEGYTRRIATIPQSDEQEADGQAMSAVPDMIDTLMPIAEEIFAHVANEAYVSDDDLNPDSHLGKITITVQDARNILNALKKAGVTEL